MKNVLRAALDNFDLPHDKGGIDCSKNDPEQKIQAAQQQFAKDADINVLVKRFGIDGQLPSNIRVPMAGDFTGAMSYDECAQAMRNADEAFMALPADVRDRFGGKPAKFVAFCQDLEKNGEEMIKMGLAVRRVNKKGEPTRVVIVDPTTGEIPKATEPAKA